MATEAEIMAVADEIAFQCRPFRATSPDVWRQRAISVLEAAERARWLELTEVKQEDGSDGR